MRSFDHGSHARHPTYQGAVAMCAALDASQSWLEASEERVREREGQSVRGIWACVQGVLNGDMGICVGLCRGLWILAYLAFSSLRLKFGVSL